MVFTLAKPGQTLVGFIGLGVMGRSMAGHVLHAGYDLTVFNRTKARADDLVRESATWADSPAAVADRCDVVLAIVGMPADVREVFLGPQGLIPAARAGQIFVDMTTSEPSLAVEIAEAAAKKGAAVLDAPVSGGDIGAKNATLSIMAGGDKAALDAVTPVLQCLGKTIVHQGGPGAGQHTKVVNQILIAAALGGVCESLLYARRAGLNCQTVLQSVGGGAAASWQLNNLGPKVNDRNFQPGFFVEHIVKDLNIALAEARRMPLALPQLGLNTQLFTALAAMGHGKLGTQALINVLELLNGIAD